MLADDGEQERFKEEISERAKNLKGDEVLVFGDECGASQHPSLGFLWAHEGERQKIPTFGNHAKRYIYGFVNPLEGRVNYHIGKRINGGEFGVSLKKLLNYYRNKKIVLVIDNAKWHKSKQVREIIEERRGRIEIIYLPRYSPDLNPVEHLWKWLRERVLHNRFFNRIKNMIKSIQGFFRWLTLGKEEVIRRCGLKSVGCHAGGI